MVAATPIVLTEDDRDQLERWVRSSTTEQRLAFRARVILAAANGEGSTAIAEREGVRLTTVSCWRVRFARRGRAGLGLSKRWKRSQTRSSSSSPTPATSSSAATLATRVPGRTPRRGSLTVKPCVFARVTACGARISHPANAGGVLRPHGPSRRHSSRRFTRSRHDAGD